MKLVISLFIAMLVVCSGVYSQQQKGDKEIQGNITVISVPEVDMTMGIIQARYGYYFTDRIQAGVFPILSISSESTTFGSGFFGSYSFLTSNAKMVPYVGAQWLSPDFGNFDYSAIGLQAGMKYFLTERVTIDGNFNYMFTVSGGYGLIYVNSGIGYIFR